MRRSILIGLGVICLILLGVFCFLRLGDDRVAPKITFSKDKVKYAEGGDKAVLLKGVTAEDNRDGDVTSSLAVDSIIPMGDGKRATVIYAARDKSNNVGKASRIVEYEEKETVSDKKETSENEQITEDAKDKEAANTGEQPSNSQNTGEKAQEEPAATGEDASEVKDELADLPEGSPKMTLKETETTVSKGGTFDKLSFVKELTDDKDDKETLWRRIRINGTVDTKTPGTYELTYYAVDTDGNPSNKAVLTVTVQ